MKKNKNLTKLYLLVISLPRGKKEIIGDLLEEYDVTVFLSVMAKGSFDKDVSKEMMFCIVKENKIKDAMFRIEDKFSSFKSKVSMLYAIPLESIIGVSSYMALTNGGLR
ncbi:MAG: hypothetical protein PUA56_03115 [Bacillales bacterium]|nr:hypothetical protein [Bacillales bacterium]